MSLALPGSPMMGPKPPARASFNGSVLPITAEPVPAITTTLGISPVAPSVRIKSLVMIIAALGKVGCRAHWMERRAFGSPAPEMPAMMYATSSGLFAARWRACKPASARAAAEACAPTLTALEGPERERARIAPDSSMRTHSVFVPPPSKPRTYLIEEEYVKPSQRCGGSSDFKPRANLNLTRSGVLRLSSRQTPHLHDAVPFLKPQQFTRVS